MAVGDADATDDADVTVDEEAVGVAEPGVAGDIGGGVDAVISAF